MSAESSPSTTHPPPSSVRRVIVASLIGTSLEWYDFFIYGTAAALVFNKLFFPSFEPLVGTLLAFATYAVGFIARPLGGVVFGHYGDKLGRKNVLVVTLLMMGIATFAIGLMPTHATIGVWAPILLVALRFVQGLGLGGEWGGAVLMTLESGDDRRRGLNASWPQVGVPIGLLLANGVLSLMGGITSDAAFLSWGWRVPFLLSGLLVIVGLWIRLTIAESPLFQAVEAEDTKARTPIVEVLRTYPRQVLLAIGARVGVDVAFYTFVLFITTYIATYLGLPRSYALNAVLVAAAVQVFLIPWFGHLSDRFGRRPVYLFGAVGAAVWVFVFFALLDTGSFLLILLATVVSLVFHAAMYGPQASFIAEMFPTRVRYTGASMGYQLAGILGGALAPIISVALLDRFDTSLVVSLYVVLVLAVTAVCVLLSPETSRLDLRADPTAQPATHPGCLMTTVTIDLNSDLGEGFGAWSLGDDDALLDVVTSANVACGFHAGDPDILRRVCELAAERGVVIGAQVGYRDLHGFGRRAMDVDPADADQRGHLPDRGAGRLRPGRRHPGQLRQAARGALQRRRAPPGAGDGGRRGDQAVRRVAAGDGPARVVDPRRGRRGRRARPSPRRSPTAATPRRARSCHGRSRGRCCTTRGTSPSGW